MAAAAEFGAALGGAAEALFQEIAGASALKLQIDLREAGVVVGLHRLQILSSPPVVQKEGAVRGLHEGALAGLVAAPDEGALGIELDLEVVVEAVVADVDGEETHGKEMSSDSGAGAE
jgi:hypothetical protein